MTATASAVTSARARSRSIPRSLDELLPLGAEELADLYAHARVPALADVCGDLRGRMLATTVLQGPVAGAARAFASSSRFPWRGKSFAPRDALRGEGINRVILDRWRLYRFETSIGPSRAGAFDALQLDYDLPENPFFIRPIKDEMRELASGLWLGQAYLQLSGRAPHLVLYFGLSR
ncbi:MAG TPA: hypothetical protein VGI39_38450 [Polyangiaceae bacterium]|jgi:hypothetical protein